MSLQIPSDRSRPAVIGMSVAMVLAASPMHAHAGGWPSDPGTPLVVGEVLGVGGNHALTKAPDDAIWSAWIDVECFGSLRVQRVSAAGEILVNEALTLYTRSDCLARDARAAACADGAVVVCGTIGGVNSSGAFSNQPIQRLSPTGAPMWGNGIFLTPPANNPGGTTGKIGQLLGAPNGDVLIAWHAGWTVFVSRYDVAGNQVWSGPAVVPTLTGSTKRIVALMADDAEDVVVVWDEPGGPYVRGLFAARVSANGQSMWAQPANIAPLVSGSSRHTDPSAVTDGSSGVVVVYTEGAESANTPMPLRMQRVLADGSLAFEPAGRRVSLDFVLQSDVALGHDEQSDDVIVAWRSGVQTQSIKAQRMTLAAGRLWGDSGITVKTLAQPGFGRDFNAHWNESREQLSVVIEDLPPPGSDARVNVYRVDGAGTVNPDASPISGNASATSIQCVAVEGALAVTWMHDAPSFPDNIVAQRINDDGTIGLPAMTGDINGDGFVNVIDLLAVISAWGPCPMPPEPCDADVNDDGAVNVADLLIVINNWG